MPRILVCGLLLIVFGFFITTPVFACHEPDHPAEKTEIDAGTCAAGLNQIENIFGRVIFLFVAMSFIAVLVVLIWAGIKFITSGGEAKALDQARSAATWAFLGVLFLALAWLILKLIAAFTGIDALTSFDIKVLCEVTGAGCPP